VLFDFIYTTCPGPCLICQHVYQEEVVDCRTRAEEDRTHPSRESAVFAERLRQIEVPVDVAVAGDRLAADLHSVVARASIAVEPMRGWVLGGEP
jgi:hypothetical protein